MLYDDWLDILEARALTEATDELDRTPATLADWLVQRTASERDLPVATSDDLSGCSVDQLLVTLFNAPAEQAMRARHQLVERFRADHTDLISSRVAELVEDELRYERERTEP